MSEPPTGVVIVPDRPRAAALVLGGSSGRIEEERCRLLAAQGIAAASIRWFGGPGQPPGICEVPLETFAPMLEHLAGLSSTLAVIGSSKGAEAALLLACHTDLIDVTCAMAPTSVVWANVGPGLDGSDYPYRSSWTLRGRPLPFATYDEDWSAASVELPAYVSLYASSLRSAPQAATIPVERISGSLILSAGGDDQVWPSGEFADRIAARRRAHALSTTVVRDETAGHRISWPTETPPPGGVLARGGTPAADAALGARVWEALLGALLG